MNPVLAAVCQKIPVVKIQSSAQEVQEKLAPQPTVECKPGEK
jgi:hypothetical protein